MTTMNARRSPAARRRTILGLAFCAPAILGLVFFTLYPITASFYYSFTRYSVMKPPVWVGPANYSNLLQDNLFWKALWNTLYFAALAVPLGIVTALGLALLLNLKIRGQALYRTFFYVPSIVPLVAGSVLWVWLFNPQNGAINAILRPILAFLHLGEPPGWFADPLWAKPAIVLWSLWGVGGSVVIFLAALQDVPRELREAAEVDGAGVLHRLRHITLPFISPQILFVFIMGLIGAFQFFTPAYVMTRGTGGPVDSTLFYSLYLFNVAFADFKMGYACALAWVLFLLILGFTLLLFKSSARHVYHAG
ncbi:MAG: sugar ABC transporter permease [Kiritimatiellaeota bacterium]|nr:sugar ABC transporter permease [Kiritimatiellota bacterium]